MSNENGNGIVNGGAVAEAGGPPVRARWRRSVIQAALVTNGMTQTDLAGAVGVAMGTISRSVTDAREPTLRESVAVAEVLGLNLMDMIEVIPAKASRPKSQAGGVVESGAVLHRGTRRK